jgi:hypothetical protein
MAMVLLGALLVYALAACTPDRQEASGDSGSASKKIDFTVRSLDEKSYSISTIRDGRPAVIEFWGVT